MLRKHSRLWSLLALLALAAGLSTAGAVAYARMLRGDIDIAGAPMDLPRRAAPPVKEEPGVKYALDCRLQLDNLMEHRDRKILYRGREYKYFLWAYADVTLDQDHRGVSSGSLRWKWLAVAEKENVAEGEDPILEIPLASPPSDAFSTTGHSLWLNSYLDDAKVRQFSIGAYVNLTVGNYFLGGRGSAQGDLSEALETTAIASIQRSSVPNYRGEPDQLWRRLYVQCTKKQ